MLSVEKPPPQDPPPPSLPSPSPCPCPCDEKSGGNLNSRSRSRSSDDDNDERVSSGKKVETETVAVDLLPTFSIRDYVFSNRSKDIKKNWPFSQEKLQVCLNHGMKEVLPPFQTLDALRQCKKNIRKNSDGKKKLYGSSDDDEKKLVVSGFQEAQDFPASSSATQSCSGDADSDSASASVPNNNNNSNNILEKEEHFVAKSSKSGNNNNNNHKPEAVAAVKKCKFMVKLSHLGHTTAGGGGGAREDGVGATMNNNNNYIVSEAMAFKVCPVCKTFSSSSNTTLNAHIDQCLCLSGDSSATKWHHGDNNNNRLLINKNRIKPRKMRSMADIYETALHCTLEELDRRNGTNWASNSCTPPPAAQETQIPAHHPDNDDDDDDDEESPNQNAVYIDANGTKVRILSKLSDPSSDSKSSDDHHRSKKKKLIKGGKFVLAKKKKKITDHIQKQQKVPKLDDAPPPPPVKKICTFDSVAHTSQIDRDQATDFPCEKNDEKVDYITRQLKTSDQGKFSKPEMIKGWVCSKRTGLIKKANGRDGNHHHSGGSTANKEMPPENIQSSRSISLKKSSIVKNRYEDSPSPSNSKRTTDTSSHETHSEYEDHHHPSPKKRESPGLRSRKRSLMVEEFPDRSPKNLKHDGNRRSEVKAGNLRNFEHSAISQKMSSSPKRILSRSKFSVLKKQALTADGRVSASDSKFYSKRKCLAVKKSRMQYISQTHRKVVVSPTRVDRHFMPSPSKNESSEEQTSSEESIERTRKVEMRDEATHHHHDVGENCGSLGQSGAFNCTSASDDNRESAGKSESAGCRRDINIELPSEEEEEEEEAVRGMFAGLNETIDSRFDGEDDDDDSRGMQHDSRQYIEEYREPLFESEGKTSSAEPILSGDEQEMFCANVDAAAEKNMMGKKDCQIVELNSSNGKGNYFDEVDPIPIPGPPGSFLPSPGRMDSLDIPGISSLSSSSRIQTSDDHSSESPISTTSTISNSTLGRKYELKSSPPQNVSGGSSPLVDQLRSDHISAVASTNVVDDFAPVRNASDDAAGGGGLDEVKFANEKGTFSSSFRYKNDQQPCCCSRKEMLTQNVGLNYQDSALLRRRTMAAAGKSEMNDDDRNVNRSLDNVRTVNERSLVPEEGVSSIATVQISSRVSSIPVHGNYESSSSPATPNPVLRLMGKNLMVVNKEENLTPPQSRTPHESSNSIANVHENSKTVPVPLVSQGPFFFDRREEETKGFIHQQHHHHHPDMRWSTGFGSHGISVRHDHHHHQVASSVESPGRMAVSRGGVMQQEYSAGTGAGGSSRYHHNHTPIQVLEPMMNLQQQYRGTKIPLNYEMEKRTGGENSSQQHLHCWKKKRSWDHPPPDKEIIIIDDTPITATAAAVGRHKQQQQQRREGGGSGSGLGCDSWSLNPFYVNEAAAATTTAVGYEYNRPIGGYNTGSGISVNNPSVRVAGGGGNENINGMRWNCNPEGVVFYQSSALAASSSPAPAPAGAPAGLFKSSGF